MIFQDSPFQFFTFWDAVESGLYYIIVGYYFLIFAYFLVIRYRTSKKYYWLYFSILFLCLAASRVFFIVYYFYTPELFTGTNQYEVVGMLMFQYRLATFSTWLAIASLMGVFGILIFPPITEPMEISEKSEFKEKFKRFLRKEPVRISLKVLLIIIPLIIGTLALFLPDSVLMDPDFTESPYNINIELVTIFGYPVGRAVLNFILLPLFVAIIPFLFINLAIKTYGVLRRSYALNAIGFFIYFVGRILQGVLDTFEWYHVRAVLPPLLILLALLIIVIANNYEQLR